MKIIVKKKDNLLNYLVDNTDWSKSKIKSLFKYKSILVNGKIPLNPNVDVKEKDTIEVSTDKKTVNIGTIPIIYEDENYLVVNKPSGMLTIATNKEKEKTLYHKVREYINSKKEKIFIVHRLDRDTSGLVVFCKNEKLRDKIQENWEKVAILREYRCVVTGIMPKKKDKLVNYLKETKDGSVYISNNTGKQAITNYEVLKEDSNSLLKIVIETGRKNQIRAQLAYINHPIIGDKKYGDNKVKSKKLLLVANRLDIKDPVSKKVLSFEVNVPREYLKNLSINKSKNM